MRVVILCGGYGTRLREETEYRPKPMVEIGGRPILWHIMKIYAHYGLRDFILCLGYRGNAIKEYFLNYEAMNNDFTICLGTQNGITYHDAHDEQDFHVTLAETGLDTLTGGRIQRVAKYIDADTFMVTYGDGLADIDLSALLAFHRAHGRIATMTTVHPRSRYGLLEVANDGRVVRFEEKPITAGWANAGFFVFHRRVFDYLTGGDYDIAHEPLERLARDGQLMAFRHTGFFFAMDTYRELQYLNELWHQGNVPWKVWQ